jgi:hypothetical protein
MMSKIVLQHLELASHEDLIKLAKILYDILIEIIEGDDMTNENLAVYKNHLKETIIKGE